MLQVRQDDLVAGQMTHVLHGPRARDGLDGQRIAKAAHTGRVQSSHQGLLHVGELPGIHIQLVTGVSLPKAPLWPPSWLPFWARPAFYVAAVRAALTSLRNSCQALSGKQQPSVLEQPGGLETADGLLKRASP